MIITFYSHEGDVSHTPALVDSMSYLARWGYRVLCVDWALAGSDLNFVDSCQPWPVARGLADLIVDFLAGTGPDIGDYVHAARLEGGGAVDVISAGSAGAAEFGPDEWAALYRDGAFSDFMEDCYQRWRRDYDVVVINGWPDDRCARGIYLAQLPDAVALTFSSAFVDASATLLRSIDLARDRLPFGRGRVLVAPLFAGDLGEIERVSAAFDAWLSPWVSRDLELADVAGALACAVVEPADRSLLAAVIAHRFGTTAALRTAPESYVAAAVEGGVAFRLDSRPDAAMDGPVGWLAAVVRGSSDGDAGSLAIQLPRDVERPLGQGVVTTALLHQNVLTVFVGNVWSRPGDRARLFVSIHPDGDDAAELAAFGATLMTDLAWPNARPPTRLYFRMAEPHTALPHPDGVTEAARAIRPYLPDLIDDGELARHLDRDIVSLLGSVPDSLPDLWSTLTGNDVVAGWVNELLEDPLFRPHDVQPVRAAGKRFERYACPVDGNFVWYREPHEPVVQCPEHKVPLVPAENRR